MNQSLCRGPIDRREFLQAGALGIGGLTLSDLFVRRAVAGTQMKETSVILLYLHGGPSQLETYDLKPEAPIEYRSVFGAISTTVPGMDICDLFPRQAKIADKIAIVRSLHHEMSSHSDGGIEVLTGKTPIKPDSTSTSKSDHPDLGSVTSKWRGISDAAVPPFVSIPNNLYMTRPTYLGLHHSGFQAGDPGGDKYVPPIGKLATGVDGNGLDDRRGLLKQLDRVRGDLDLQGNMQGNDHFRRMAFDMLTNPNVATAFDLEKENSDLRDKYGRNTWGQGCLLARRLAEAGVGVITLYTNTPKNGQEYTNWDDHIGNAGRPGHFAKYMRVRLPYLDQSLATLIEDIYTRDLDRKIMVVVMGEFGRTPRLSVNSSGAGRNHWPQAYSVLFSGGSLRVGQVVGATNARAEYPTERPYTPKDVLATIYRHLGINWTDAFIDHTGRPIPILPHGHAIPELI
ncbi:MAG: hypothetical protein CMJ64_15885 [Planctomycetaceae bacterium]|nr:hypothetical protein [Planctomycetaceae bacterium]